MRVLCIGMMWGTLGGEKNENFGEALQLWVWVVLCLLRSVAFHESQGQDFSQKNSARLFLV